MMVKPRSAARRVSHLTEEQRRAIDHARELLWPHFRGETVKLYVPVVSHESRAGRNQRILQSIAGGEAVDQIARREGVACRTVQRLAVMLRHSPP
jgi:DNA-binding NarL/FixJ family response regulator